MPPPTREQFNAAAAKVSASAPPGLSREDFYNLIDHELATPPSYGDDVLSTLKGEGEGLVSGLTSPFLHPIDTAKGAYNTVRHPIDTVKGISKILTEGSAEDLGQLYGNVAGGAILGKVAAGAPRTVRGIVKAAPDALAATGKGLERAGDFTKRVSPYGMAEAALRGDWKGGAVAAAPYAMKGTGSLLRKAGEWLGAETPEAAPSAPLVEGFDRYMPNVSAPKASTAPMRATSPTSVETTTIAKLLPMFAKSLTEGHGAAYGLDPIALEHAALLKALLEQHALPPMGNLPMRVPR